MGCGKSQNRPPPRNNKSAVFSLVNLAVKTTLSAFAAERRAAAPLLLGAGIFCLRSTSPDSGVLSSKPPLLLSTDGTDRRTDGRTLDRFVDPAPPTTILINFNDLLEIVPTTEITTKTKNIFLVRGRGPIS